MPSSLRNFTLLGLISAALAQIPTLPECVQNCISGTGDYNCNGFNISCVCRESTTYSFGDIIHCVDVNCPDDLSSVLQLLPPLQVACGLAGDPLPDALVTSAEAAISSATASLASAASASASSTASVGQITVGGATTMVHPTPMAGTRTSTSSTVPAVTATTATTITETTTNSAGSTVFIIAPVTIEPSTTIYGATSTVLATEAISPVSTQSSPFSGSSSNSFSSTSSSDSTSSSSTSSSASAASASSSTSSESSTLSSTTTTHSTASTSTSDSGSSNGGNPTNGAPFAPQSSAPLVTAEFWLLRLCFAFGALLVLP